ncbi:sodium-dependent phosphate transporter [Anopheles darlingi]|uniref:Sodium-dependent phosphate transporter n=1 Tax=Anopheles darlingi TaxID=43151 RepID=W5J3K3_ANODA|nr:sodium-dependent phosphate transporter [Anopheles darlingi]
MAKDEPMSARTTLWYLVFVGFAVNYMIRINTNITIVAMIKQSETEFVGQTKVDYACYVANDSIASEPDQTPPSLEHSLLRSREGKIISPEQLLLRLLKLDLQEDGFDWNDYQQGIILGAFYWLHWITQIPGGILARRYGTKLVFGASNVIGCWLCFLMPIASYWDYRILVFLRVVQGLICGLAWPAMHHMAGQWIPPNERSKFVTAYLGSSIGVALNFPLFGFIIAHTSWEYVYHFCGIFGTVWYVAWLYLVYDSPSEHPRIHPAERKFIESSLGISDHGTQGKREQDMAPTPWKQIILSKPMWMTVIAQWGGIWGLFTLMTQAPTYFNNVHGWNIEMTGLLSGIPHLCRMLFAYVFSIIGDHLLKHELMSRTGVRKMGGTMCCVVNGIFVFALANSGCNSLMATIFLTLATTVHGAVSTGPLANLVDMSPRYAGILLGFSGMITVIPGFVSPIIVGMLGNHTVEQWRIIFLITAATLIVCGLLYMAFADSSQQAWNSADVPVIDDGKAEELEGLQALNNDPSSRNIVLELDSTKEPKTDEMIRLSSV